MNGMRVGTRDPVMPKGAFFRNRGGGGGGGGGTGAGVGASGAGSSGTSTSPVAGGGSGSGSSKPSALPRLQTSFATGMRGYAPLNGSGAGAGRRTPTATGSSSPATSPLQAAAAAPFVAPFAPAPRNPPSPRSAVGSTYSHSHSTSATSSVPSGPGGFANTTGPEPAWGAARGHGPTSSLGHAHSQHGHALGHHDALTSPTSELDTGIHSYHHQPGGWLSDTSAPNSHRLVMSPTSDHGQLDPGMGTFGGASGSATVARTQELLARMGGSPRASPSPAGPHSGVASEHARTFSPPQYGGYASQSDHDPTPFADRGRSSSSADGTGDYFTPIRAMSERRKRSGSRGQDRIGAYALSSPPPHERHAARTEASHESALSGSSTGLMHDSGPSARPHLSRSTSTVVTAATAVTSPAMGSDEMLMALMASQAAVDCNQMPIGGWEEVDSWQKELSLLSTRLDALQARHQREVKILTAARTLQKLNQANKRLSKQTMESLEQSERRVEQAEKEVLVLRSREASLRRKLMEHWAGVLAWEVRRLERTSSETQSRLEMHVRAAENDRDSLIERLAAIDVGEQVPPAKMIDSGEHTRELAASQTREKDLIARVAELENTLQQERLHNADLESRHERSSAQVDGLEADKARDADRIAELEDMVVDLGRRERSLEDGARGHDEKILVLEREKADWHRERESHADQRGAWEAERTELGDRHAADRDLWQGERAQLLAERAQLVEDRDALQAAHEAFQTESRERDASNGQAWATERERLTSERGVLQATHAAELERVLTDRDELHHAHAALQNRHAEDQLAWDEERARLIAERELLEATAAPAATWQREREALTAKNERMANDIEALAVEHDRIKEELRTVQAAHAATATERAKRIEQVENENARLSVANGQATTALKATAESLSTILGRDVMTTGIVPALDEMRALFNTRAMELQVAQERHADELQTVVEDRDAWKAKNEAGGSTSRAAQEQMTELVRKIRSQNEQIATLTAQVQTGGSSGQGSVATADRGMEDQLQQVWSALPSPSARAEAGLTSRGIGSQAAQFNITALQRAYKVGSNERFTNVNDLAQRVFGLVADGRVMIERMQRLEQEKELHKTNAQRAAQLVTDSRASLEGWQQQVAALEERLDREEKSRHAEEKPVSDREIQLLHRELEQAYTENQRLQKEADEHEKEKGNMQGRLQREVESLRAELRVAMQGLEEERTRAEQQSATMMGEMMDFQDEIARLRAKR